MLTDCGLTSTLVRDMNRGQMPSADKILKIAQYLEVSVEYLMGVTDDPTPPNKKKSDDPLIEITDLLKQIGITDEAHIKSAKDILELMKKNENNAEFADGFNEDGLGTKQSG